MTRIAEGLAERDLALLRRVGEHGFLTREQITRFAFTEHASKQTAERTSRRVLTRLERDGLLRSLPRRQGGMYGGSTPAVWQLTSAGARLLRGSAGRAHRVSVPSVRWLNHCLAVAETHLAICACADTSSREVEVAVEQAGWRTRIGLGGEAIWLKPDLFARIAGRDDEGAYQDYWFVEVDLGTESLPTLLRKASQYQAHYQSGVEQDQLGTFPLVLWVFAGYEAEDRRAELATRLRASRALDGRLHRTRLSMASRACWQPQAPRLEVGYERAAEAVPHDHGRPTVGYRAEGSPRSFRALPPHEPGADQGDASW
ncbi:MAG: replication-relaxation family protein [Nocardioides sp.]